MPSETNGQILRVLMNAELDQAVAFLAPPQKEAEQVEPDVAGSAEPARSTGAGVIAWHSALRRSWIPRQFGVKAFYLIGSTKNATAGPRATSIC